MSIDGPTEDRQGLFDRRRSSWFLGPASAAVALHFVGCLGEPYAPPTSCGNGADANKNYTANIEEAYDARVTDVKFDPVFAEIEPSCAGFDSLDVGSTITFAITSMVENVGCTVHRADATLPTSVNETGDATHLGGSYAATFALFHRSVSVRSCTGVVEVKFKAPSGRPLDAKSPSQPPPFLVDRSFKTAEASLCPAFGGATGAFVCEDTWAAALIQQ